MTRARHCSCLLGVAFVFLFATTPVRAIGPSYVMFYGGSLDAPVVHALPLGSATFLWSPYRDGGTIPADLEGRAYVTYAIFWGRWERENLTPEGASQHGRLYLPTSSAPAMVVMTHAVMEDGSPDHPGARPVPQGLEGFWKAWPVSADELATIQRFGVAGL